MDRPPDRGCGVTAAAWGNGDVDDDRDEWLAARKGKITGSRLGNIIQTARTKGKKIAYYELIAERIAIPEESDVDESGMDRGTRLEPEALARFASETGKKVNTDLIIWSRDDNESIAISPDGIIGKKEAVECKCLSSALHIKAYLTQAIPDDYEEQVLQYFIVNDKLETLYFMFYDPRVPGIDFFYLTVTRESVQAKVDEYLEYERATLAEIADVVNSLTF